MSVTIFKMKTAIGSQKEKCLIPKEGIQSFPRETTSEMRAARSAISVGG
jgi:hypothetical protein